MPIRRSPPSSIGSRSSPNASPDHPVNNAPSWHEQYRQRFPDGNPPPRVHEIESRWYQWDHAHERCDLAKHIHETYFADHNGPLEPMHAYAEMDAEIRAEGVPPEAQERVDAIMDRLHQTSGCDLDSLLATVVADPPYAAWLVDGRQIEIGAELLASLSDVELAGILAHEMGHAAAQHNAQEYFQRTLDLKGRERWELDLTQSCAVDATSRERVEQLLHERAEPRIVNEWIVQENDDPQYEDEAKQGMRYAWKEMQADAIGVRLLARAGYPPQATRDFLVRSNEEHAAQGEEIAYGEARIEHINQLLQVRQAHETLASAAHAAVLTLPPGEPAPDQGLALDPDTPVPQVERDEPEPTLFLHPL